MKNFINELRLSYHETPAQTFCRTKGIDYNLLSKKEKAILNVVFSFAGISFWSCVYLCIQMFG